MNEDWEQLERSIENDLAAIAARMDAPPPPEAVRRAQLAARAEVNAAWLASQETLKPSTSAVELTRRAVREELRRTEGSSALRAWCASPWGGATAAAAVLLLAVGLARWTRTATVATTDSLVERMVNDPAVTLFVQASQQGYAADGAIEATIETDLKALEKSISQWESAWGDLDDMMRELDAQPAGQSLRERDPASRDRLAAGPSWERLG